MTIKYNMINIRKNRFDALELDTTLECVNEIFKEKPFNYNITNSILPKFVKLNGSKPSIRNLFAKILVTINTRLKSLPHDINNVGSGTDGNYNDILFDMKLNGFGYNDMIRKNILYSLNAQIEKYIKKYIKENPTIDFYKDKISPIIAYDNMHTFDFIPPIKFSDNDIIGVNNTSYTSQIVNRFFHGQTRPLVMPAPQIFFISNSSVQYDYLLFFTIKQSDEEWFNNYPMGSIEDSNGVTYEKIWESNQKSIKYTILKNLKNFCF
jgi:hypothetical protein